MLLVAAVKAAEIVQDNADDAAIIRHVTLGTQEKGKRLGCISKRQGGSRG